MLLPINNHRSKKSIKKEVSTKMGNRNRKEKEVLKNYHRASNCKNTGYDQERER